MINLMNAIPRYRFDSDMMQQNTKKMINTNPIESNTKILGYIDKCSKYLFKNFFCLEYKREAVIAIIGISSAICIGFYVYKKIQNRYQTVPNNIDMTDVNRPPRNQDSQENLIV